jgi:hypothetical protein
MINSRMEKYFHSFYSEFQFIFRLEDMVEWCRYSYYEGYTYGKRGGPRGTRQKKLQNLDSMNYLATLNSLA